MKNTELLLGDMLDAIAAIKSYAVPTYDEFLEDEMTWV